eukprot:CAMPEP_0203685540 /NCGR_PEP_ID=MMETSP0090-20130426/48598_1 /ASSEMBLY_ACC=CAM_ASM_001088 /TAXON_ID=426623 /ORGANISM="Chaetoceros affinis, Strain CCMP159" /LENGTH=331 /DNA_ID=CAMNT_0050554737 /DNA_START=2488 /DNA_END=3483 /DNA_ORIENTATION=-
MKSYKEEAPAGVGATEDCKEAPQDEEHDTKMKGSNNPSLLPAIPLPKKRRIDVDHPGLPGFVIIDNDDHRCRCIINDKELKGVNKVEAETLTPILEEDCDATHVNIGRTTSSASTSTSTPSEVDSEPSILLHTPKPIYPHKSIEENNMYIENIRQAYDSWNISYNDKAMTATVAASAAARSASASASASTLRGKDATASPATSARSIARLINNNHQEHDFYSVGATSSAFSTTVTATPTKAKKTHGGTVQGEVPYNLTTTPTTSQKYHTPIQNERKNYTLMASRYDLGDHNRNRNDDNISINNAIHNDPFLESYLRGPPPLRRRNDDNFWS